MRVGQAHQPRRVHRALADPGQAAVAAVCERLIVQDLDVQPGRAGHPLRLRGERGRVQIRGAGVDQVAYQRHGVGQHSRAGRGARSVAAEQDHVGVLLLAGVPAERIAAEQRAERHRLGLRAVACGQRERDPQWLAVGECADRGAGRAAQGLAVERRRAVGGRADADRGDQRRGQLPGRRDLGHFLCLAGGAQRGEGLGEVPAEGGVHLLGTGRRHRPVGSLGHADDDRVGLGDAG